MMKKTFHNKLKKELPFCFFFVPLVISPSLKLEEGVEDWDKVAESD